MKNPWQELSFVEDTYVLRNDWDSIRQHNQLVGGKPTKFSVRSIPEPFIGNPNSATVVLLGKNPGHDDNDLKSYDNSDFREAMFRNLRHESQECPFYPLNPKFDSTGAGNWWRKVTRRLREAGVSDDALGKKLMVIEWFPYHSKRFARPKSGCASQDYSFWLAREMLKNKLVVRMRSKREWAEVGPEFLTLPALKNPQCGHISRRNADGILFEKIVDALEH